MEKRPFDVSAGADGQVVDQFGQVMNPFQPMVGPVPVPWELWRWWFNPLTGKFKTIPQDYTLEVKTMKVLSKGFRDKSVQGRMHNSGSPAFSVEQVEAIFSLAEAEKCSLGEAMLAWATKTKVGLNPDFVEQVEKGPRKYPFALTGESPKSDPLRDAHEEIRKLKEENALLQEKAASRRRPSAASAV